MHPHKFAFFSERIGVYAGALNSVKKSLWLGSAKFSTSYDNLAMVALSYLKSRNCKKDKRDKIKNKQSAASPRFRPLWIKHVLFV